MVIQRCNNAPVKLVRTKKFRIKNSQKITLDVDTSDLILINNTFTKFLQTNNDTEVQELNEKVINLLQEI